MKLKMKNRLFIICLIFCVSIQLKSQVIVPYFSSFDSTADTVGWKHYAISGTDDWALGTPSKTYFNSSFSNPNGWVTNLTGSFAGSSVRCLESPVFDLSDTIDNYYFSVYHKRHSYVSAGFYIEYSLDSGVTWLMLSGAAIPQKSWQSVSLGFTTYIYTSFQNSTFSLKHLQGNSAVSFRFRMNTSALSGEGWLIDDFSIRKEDFNVIANRGLDITNLNENFTQFTVISTLGFYNPYSNSVSMKNSFYFSTDSIFDVSDSLLYSSTVPYSMTIPSWSKTINLPPNLFARNYYVFYQLDESDTINETNETNNISYAVIKIDSIIVSNYSDNFDHTDEYWNAHYTTPLASEWNKGDPNQWQAEDPHSGNNCWYPVETVGANINLESPYLNLSGTTNNTICFWYRDTRNSTYYSPSSLDVPLSTLPATTVPPIFPSPAPASSYLPYPRNSWDCYCRSISAFDGNISTKFRITGGGNQDFPNLKGIIVDDMYIGTAKPDLSIEGEKKNRFTTDARSSDTLFYLFYNSGLQSCPVSQTHFYWSVDSILDGGDILLSSKVEPALWDTAFSKQTFVYTKPTLAAGKYYILYVTDPTSLIDEMREYNNTGYFELHQQSFTALPYSNDFETQINNWTHHSSLGMDDWEWGIPSKPSIPNAFSGNLAWVTNDSAGVSPHSRMHLLSPVFDLSQLSDPVIKFDMKNIPIDIASSWYYGGTNMTYSVDGGYEWKVLKPINRSFARWYDRYDFENTDGRDKITYSYSSNIFEGKYEPTFNDFLTYQTRDADDITTFCMDLGFLSSNKQVQFKLNFASESGMVDGVMIDDFVISEGLPDLEITNTRNLFCDSTDIFLKINLSIKNNGNKQIDQINYNVYLSTDSLLDGSDFLFYSDTNSDSLKPYFRREYFIKNPTPLNYGSYNYAVFELDPGNLVVESNELNNIKSWPLSIVSNPTLSYFNDFNAEEIHGWTQYIDSSEYWWGHRFRHIRVANDPCFGASSGEWFLDPMNTLPSYLSGTTRHYLESPSFDFSNHSNIIMEFDFVCVGAISGGNQQGGNAQYSEDGGVTWITLTVFQDPYAVNWYNGTSIATIFGQPGWGFIAGYLHANYDLSFLQGKSNIRIRFQHRGNHQYTVPGHNGFRLDNFKITASTVDLVANEIWVPVMADINQPYFTINYTVSNTGNGISLPTTTNFFWSEDNILDTTDIELYSFPESIINGMSSNTHVRNIYYPIPVTQMVYYLFYIADKDTLVNESDETNNYGSYIVTFNGLSGVDELASDKNIVASVNEGILIVSGRLAEYEKSTIAEIYSINGKMLISENFDIGGNLFKIKIPIETLSSGVYVLNLRFGVNKSERIKFTITK